MITLFTRAIYTFDFGTMWSPRAFQEPVLLEGQTALKMMDNLVAFLVLAILHHGMCQENHGLFAISDAACHCFISFDDTVRFAFGYYQPPYSVQCEKITEPEDVACLWRMLETTQFHTGLAFEFVLHNSNLDLITSELLAPYNVTTFQFQSCNMSEVPYELLWSKNPFVLQFIRSKIPGSTLIPGGFRNCTHLQKLMFFESDLVEIPPGSFVGLGSLRSLLMPYNMLQDLPDFEGLYSSLQLLGVHNNPIKSVSKTAFRGLTNLTGLVLVNANITTIEDGIFDSLGPNAQVFLSGNPFFCDCSLQWLQDWLLEHPSNASFMTYMAVRNDDPKCVAPNQGPLKTLAFCNSSKTSRVLATSQTDWFKELAFAFWHIIDFVRNSF